MNASDSERSIILSIDSQMDDIFLVGLAIRAYAEHLGLDESDAARVELAIVEAVNNAIEHASGGLPGHQVDISVTIQTGVMIVTVSCVGPPIPNFKEIGVINDPSGKFDLPERGWGLQIIHEVMDNVHFEKFGDRQILTMKKLLPDRD